MTMTSCLPNTGTKPHWDEILGRLGFTAVDAGFEHDDFRLTIDTDWCAISQALIADSELPLLEEPGAPGLWKRVQIRGVFCRRFMLPISIVADEDQDEFLAGDEPILAQCLGWAMTTARGLRPADWKAPERERVQSWFNPQQLTVVSGSLLCQGELICEPDRLALSFPVLPQIPADLPPARRAWLQRLFEAAENRWHLVRFGFQPEPEGIAAVAEMDFTGAPAAVLENLFGTGLEALRWAVQWLSEPADWLADVAVASELLAVCPQSKVEKGAK